MSRKSDDKLRDQLSECLFYQVQSGFSAYPCELVSWWSSCSSGWSLALVWCHSYSQVEGAARVWEAWSDTLAERQHSLGFLWSLKYKKKKKLLKQQYCRNFRFLSDILLPWFLGQWVCVHTCKCRVNRTGSIEVLHWDGGYTTREKTNCLVSFHTCTHVLWGNT